MRRGAAGPLLTLAVLAASLFPGCAPREDGGSQLDVTWALKPDTPAVGPATLIVTVRTPSGEPVSGARMRLEGHMSHPGMAPVLADAAERAPGVYEIPFSFTMQGDWSLLVSAALPGGARLERRIDVAGVRSAARR